MILRVNHLSKNLLSENCTLYKIRSSFLICCSQHQDEKITELVASGAEGDAKEETNSTTGDVRVTYEEEIRPHLLYHEVVHYEKQVSLTCRAFI